jgi:hypothetical protein
MLRYILCHSGTSNDFGADYKSCYVGVHSKIGPYHRCVLTRHRPPAHPWVLSLDVLAFGRADVHPASAPEGRHGVRLTLPPRPRRGCRMTDAAPTGLGDSCGWTARATNRSPLRGYPAQRRLMTTAWRPVDVRTCGRVDGRTFALSEAQPKSNLWMHQDDFHVTKGSRTV